MSTPNHNCEKCLRKDIEYKIIGTNSRGLSEKEMNVCKDCLEVCWKEPCCSPSSSRSDKRSDSNRETKCGRCSFERKAIFIGEKDVDKCNKCNGAWNNPRNEYFIAVFKLKEGNIDGVEKSFCQVCWEQEEKDYQKEAGRIGDNTKTKMVQKGKKEWGQVSRTICYNWNTKQWTENAREDLGNPNDDIREREREREHFELFPTAQHQIYDLFLRQYWEWDSSNWV